jgi:hypothetical protein
VNSQITSTRSKPDSTRRTSKFWTCSKPKDHSRCFSSHSIRTLSLTTSRNGLVPPTLSRSPRLNSKTCNWSSKSRLRRRGKRRKPSTPWLAKMSQSHWSWSESWRRKIKSSKIKSTNSVIIESQVSQLNLLRASRLLRDPWRDHLKSKMLLRSRLPSMKKILSSKLHCQHVLLATDSSKVKLRKVQQSRELITKKLGNDEHTSAIFLVKYI